MMSASAGNSAKITSATGMSATPDSPADNPSQRWKKPSKPPWAQSVCQSNDFLTSDYSDCADENGFIRGHPSNPRFNSLIAAAGSAGIARQNNLFKFRNDSPSRRGEDRKSM